MSADFDLLMTGVVAVSVWLIALAWFVTELRNCCRIERKLRRLMEWLDGIC